MKNDYIDNVMDRPVYQEKKRYFDKIDKDEESLIEVDDDTQLRYQQIEKIYNEVIPDQLIEDAKDKSRSERDRLGIKDDDSYVYGEMTFRALSYSFEVIKKHFGEKSINEGNFYDLGSVYNYLIQ